MRYLSVCSGIEAATVAWHHMGWKPVGFSEIEPFPSKVLNYHYPETPNFGDMTKFKEWNINDPVELLVGGTPCQSFSVAGLRKGLADPRGNLMLTYLAMADHFKPKWLLWENVPGVLSSNRGHDFAALLQGMAELGYGFAYRVLDAQYFGVPQRRRRVFVVGCLGDWRSAAKVLFESESLCRDITPSRNKEERTSDWPKDCASTLNASFGNKQGLENQHINQGAPLFVPAYALVENIIGRQPENGGNGNGWSEDVMYTLNATGVHGVASYSFDSLASNSMKSKNPNSGCRKVDLAKTLDTSSPCPSKNQGGIAIMTAHGISDNPSIGHCLRSGASRADKPDSTTYVTDMRVRRLTPMECEKLQGFPDNYTNIPNAPDTGRYKALGNSMAVPVMRWIGERIEAQKM